MAAVVEVEVATKEWMVLPDTLAGLVVEVMAIPTTALLEPEDVIELALLRFRTILLVTVGVPTDTTIPLVWAVAVAVELLFRLATVFPETVTVDPEVTAIPVTEPVPVLAVVNSMLPLVVVLPMRLF